MFTKIMIQLTLGCGISGEFCFLFLYLVIFKFSTGLHVLCQQLQKTFSNGKYADCKKPRSLQKGIKKKINQSWLYQPVCYMQINVLSVRKGQGNWNGTLSGLCSAFSPCFLAGRYFQRLCNLVLLQLIFSPGPPTFLLSQISFHMELTDLKRKPSNACVEKSQGP